MEYYPFSYSKTVRRIRNAPDLIRMDRALLYMRNEINSHIEAIRSKNTKTIGDYYYRLSSFSREMAQILAMGGDPGLAEKTYSAMGDLTTRTPRTVAVSRLEQLSSVLESYELVENTEDVAILRSKLASLEPQSKEQWHLRHPNLPMFRNSMWSS